MAQREGQGLQIAVIIFAMLTIVLAITTYIFYAQSQSAYQERDKKVAELGEERTTNGKLMYRVQALKFVLGMGNVTKQDIELAKTRAGNAADTEVDEIMTNFDNDMAQVGDQVAGDQARNYRRLAVIHQGVIDKRNASLASANEMTRKAEQDKNATVAAETQRTKTAEDAAAKAAQDQKDELDKLVSYRQQIDADKVKLTGEITKVSSKAKSDLERESKEKEGYVNLSRTQQQTIGTLKERNKELESKQQDLFENPDGHITLVNQQQRIVWIDVGRADGLLKQTTFSVYDHDESRVASDKVKARIEVINLGDHLSGARILEDKPSNPIIKGDIIHTPAWSPGQRIHFAMAGRMDIDRDHIDDYEKVKRIIELNGGIIDAELRPNGQRSGPGLNIQTRYLVLGDMPKENASKDYLAQYTAIQTEIKHYGTEVLPVKNLLALMGWKAEERTVELAGAGGGGGDFRKRAPGKAQSPAAGAAPASTPVPETVTPAAGGAIDPFGSPAAAPPAAAPAADPFGAPAPAPKPAGGDANPFK